MGQAFLYGWRINDADDSHLIARPLGDDSVVAEAISSGVLTGSISSSDAIILPTEYAPVIEVQHVQVAMSGSLGDQSGPFALAQAVPPSVAEIVVYARKYIPVPSPSPGSGGGSGGGASGPPAGGGHAPPDSAIPDWVKSSAQAYVDSHVDASSVNMNDPYAVALLNAVERDLNKLYTAALGNTFISLNGPLSFDSTPGELLQDLNNINIVFTNNTVLGGGAQTVHNTPYSLTILINPTQIQNQHYENQFHYANGITYTLFHELGHAVSDYTSYYIANGQTTVNAEAFANTYGYSLSALAHDGGTITYPNPAELAIFGGWLGL